MFLIVALLCGALTQTASAQKADWIVENANIYTVDPARPRAKALAISGATILEVGDDLSSFAGPQTRRIDAKGRTLLPGLIDSHVHLRGLGALLESADFRFTKTTAEVADWVKQQAAKRKPGEWIVARNWDQTNWGGVFPEARDLDAASPDNPVFLSRVDGHAGWVNTKAMQVAGLTKDSQDPSGGKIIRNAKGEPTGVLIDRAMGLVRGKIPAATDEQVKRQLALASKECARLGLTSVHDAGVSAQDLKAYRELITEGSLPLRIYAMIGGEGALWRDSVARGPELGDFLTVRAIKLYADGALGSRGAALWQPYSDDKENTGLLMTAKADIERVSKLAAEKGFQVCTHAIGDRANRLVLDAYQSALGGKNDKRFRVEHAQIVSLPDFQMYADNSVIASVQSTHATSDMRWAEKRLGPDRIAGAYAWRRFLQMGIPVANGSDFPVEEPNPMLGLYSAFSRQDLTGNPPGGWTPDQRMTREEALYSWTQAGAYAAFEEKRKGSLSPGKLADFILVDRDVMQASPIEVPKTKVLLTVLGGKIVYGQP